MLDVYLHGYGLCRSSLFYDAAENNGFYVGRTVGEDGIYVVRRVGKGPLVL